VGISHPQGTRSIYKSKGDFWEESMLQFWIAKETEFCGTIKYTANTVELFRRFKIAEVFWRVTNECDIPSKKWNMYTVKTIYVQNRLREGRFLPKIFIMALKSTRRACKHWFFSRSFLQAVLSRHLEYNAPAVLSRRVRVRHYRSYEVSNFLYNQNGGGFAKVHTF